MTASTRHGARAPIRLTLCAAAMLFTAAPLQAAVLYRIVDLGGLGSNVASVVSMANAINDLGMVVGSAYAAPGFHAVLFDTTGAGNNIDLGTLGGESSAANDINNKNVIVGHAEQADGTRRATRFDASGGGANVNLGTLGGPRSSATAINDDNVIVGEADTTVVGSIDEIAHATRFDASGGGANLDLTPPAVPVRSSTASDISASGLAAGYSTQTGDFEAVTFRTTAPPTMTGLGDLVSNYSKAFAINASNTVVGEGFDGANLRAALFDAGGNVDLGTLGGDTAGAFGINDLGDIVGLSHDATGASRATLFDATGGGANIDLNDLVDPLDPLFGVFDLQLARDINIHGQIVGFGERDGRRRAFLLNPFLASVPEPATIAMAGLGMLLMLGVSTRRRHPGTWCRRVPGAGGADADDPRPDPVLPG